MTKEHSIPDQQLTQLEVDEPLKTVQEWVYRGVVPSPANQAKLDDLVACKHHWVIEAANGPVSNGKCRLCGEVKEFSNSTEIRSAGWTSQPQQYPNTTRQK